MAKRFTKLLAALALLISLVIPMGVKGQIRDTQTVSYGWETNDDATLWTISDAIVATQGEGNTGTYAGKINTNSTTVQFKEKVYVTSFSYAFKRTSSNNNYSVYIETSTDGQTWSIKDTQAMNTFSSNGTYRTVTKEFDGSQELYVRFRCNNTTAIRYVDDVTITYASSATHLDPCDLTLTNASTSIVFDLYDNSDAYVINYTTSSTGEVTVSDSEYITTVVDQTNKTITVTPVAVTNGAKVITVNQAADDNYAAGSKTFTINITDSTPFTGGDVTFNATIDKDLENTTQGEGSITKLGVTFACNNGILGNGSEYRMYKNSMTTFSVSEGTITQIAFTGTSSNPASGFATQTGWTTDGNNGTWIGNAQEVSFTASGAQVRATVIVVTVDLNGVPAPSVTLTPRTDIYTPVSAYQIEYPYVSSGGYVDNVICNNFTPDQFSVVFCDADGQSIDTNPDWIITAEVAYFDNNRCLNLETSLNEGPARTTYLKVGAANGPVMVYSDLVTVTQEAAPVIYATIPALFNAATDTETSVLVTFNNWVVSGVSTNGMNVFVTDNNGNGFVIFDDDGGLAQTYSVGSILSGTAVSCSLKKYNGFAELLNVNASDLTITDGGTVATSSIAMADLAGVNTGALVHYENLTCSVVNSGSSTKYYLTDGTTTLQVYNSLFNFNALTAGKSYHISGIYQQFNNTKEILPCSAADIEEVAVPYITLSSFSPSAPNSPYEIEFTYWSSGGLIDIVEYGNFPYALTAQDFFIQHCNAAGEPLGDIPGWYIGGTPTVVFDTDNLYLKVEVSQNESHETRTAYFKVCAYDANQNTVYSDLVTVNQAAAPTFAELPFAFNYGRDSIPGIDGLSQNGLGTDYITNNTKLRFDGTGDWLLLQFDERPGTLTFDIKNNGFYGGTFKVQTSEDGVTYTDLETYTEISGTQSEEFTDLGENVRYVKWIYTNKSSGNVGLGNIALAKYEEPQPSITITPDVVNLDAGQQLINLLDLAYENIEVEGPSSFTVHYYNAQGDEIELVQGEAWLVAGVVLQDSVYQVLFTVVANYGEARTAYFKVSCGETYSNLVTVTQAAPVIDYATLPFVWAGGSSADFAALNGVTLSGNGSDYNSNHAPYLIKFDGTGDYIQVKCDQQPGKVTIGVKMIGGATTSTITIQGSADGETFTDVEELTISGAQNDVLTLETTNAFAANVRYVRMLFTKGSNVGVGPISIAVVSNEASIAVNPDEVNVDADEHDGTLDLTYESLTITDMTDFDIQFCDANGDELSEEPDWIEVLVAEQDPEIGEGYVVSYYMVENEGPDARTAYFKVYAMDDETNLVYSNLVTISQAAAVVPPTPGTWVLTDLADLTEDDVFVIVGTRTDETYGGDYAMSNDNGTSNPPAAVAVTVAEGTLSVEPAANLQWNISITEDSYTFYPNGETETWLYCTNSNNGVRVGTNTNNVFVLDNESGYLKNVATSRYIGIYNSQDWRCYTSEGGNIANQTFAFYKAIPMTQTIELASGANWVSFYVDITLDDLKEALLNALGDDATNIKITSQSNGYTYWDGSTWRGTLNPFDVSQMFVIEVTGACEISLEAMPVNPARPITIVNGTNWIGFPFSESMSLSNAFSDFAENGDKILAPNGSFATYNGDNWEGELELRPGQGYKYEVTTTGVRNLVFPSSK